VSYQEAKACFAQNLQMIGNPMSDAMNWNLNSGLDELTTCVQQDMAQIQDILTQILHALRQR
jgi:hypothetical protein